MASFGSRISSLRKQKGLSQQELADRLNVSKSSIAMYETEKREPDFEILERLAEYFSVSIDYLIGRANSNTLVGVNLNVDPEIADLLEKLQQKGAELEATAILRTASKMDKEQLKDVLKVFEMIDTEKKHKD